MSPKFSIRVLDRGDAAEFQRFRLQALQESPAAFGSSYTEEVETPMTEIAKRLKPKADSSWVLGSILETGELVGTIGFARERGPKHVHKAMCWGFYVKPELRGHKMGTLLANEFLKRARQVSGLRMITLRVNPIQEQAVRLYVSIGFQTFGREPGALKVGDTYFDVDHMFLRIAG